MMRRLLLCLLAAVVATIGLAGLTSTPASAHSGEQSYVYLEIFDTAIAGRVEYPVKDLNEILGLDFPEDEDGIVEKMEEHADLLERYTRQHLSIGPAEGGNWSYEFDDEYTSVEASNGSYGVLHFEISESFDPPPRVFTMRYDGIIESKPDRDAFLLIATDWQSGTFNNEASTFLRFDDDTREHLVELDDTSWWKGFSGTVELGVEHIRIGTDHILFVLALVLPSVLVFGRFGDDDPDEEAQWHPAPSFGGSLWRILKIATMFTIAHSITLALGGLEVVELSPRLVESIIAISIAVAAIHNIRPVWPNREWAMAFGFGLFHGFGFAGLLSELGLDRSNRFQSLLGFNIGVELGQAAIIILVFPVLFIMRRTRAYRFVLVGGSLLLAAVALSWAFERIFDYDTNVTALVDPIFRWPRVVIVVAAALAAATGLWARGRARGTLRPVARADDEPAIDERPLVDA